MSHCTLVTLLFFVVIATIIISSAVVAIIVNSTATSQFQEGNTVYYVAESGVENAMIRLLRDPAYQGETIFIADGIATISATAIGNSYVINSTGSIGNFRRKIEVIVQNSNNKFSIQSWKEVF